MSKEELRREIEDLRHQIRHKERIERDLRSHIKDQQDRLVQAHEKIGRLKALIQSLIDDVKITINSMD